MNVLVIEDEQKIADILLQGLQTAGFQTHHAADGLQGLQAALINHFDAIVMDVSMPVMDGFQALAEMRRKGIHTPVIMLTARTELSDRLQGFASGTDDYLAKPFFMEELIVRIKTLIARRAGNVENVVRQSGLTLNRLKRLVEWEQQSVALTQREFVLLECLMLSPGQIFSRQQILKHVWNVDFDPGTNVVDVRIQRLRKKLANPDPNSTRPFPIETIRGVGYRLNDI